MYDILTNPEEPHGGVLSTLYNYGTHDMESLREFFLDDKVVAGFADGGAHMKLQCEATAPTTMLTFSAEIALEVHNFQLNLLLRSKLMTVPG